MAAALVVAWVVAILPSIPLPYAQRLPRLPEPITTPLSAVVTRGAAIGSGIGTLGWVAWAFSAGLISREEHDPALLPIASRAWLEDVTSWGHVAGMFADAALPVWLLWMAGRLLSRSPRRLHRPLDLWRALRDTVAWIRTNPIRFMVLAAVGALAWLGDSAIRGEGGAGWSMRSARLVLVMGLGSLAGVLQYGLGLSLMDGRPRTVREAFGSVGRLVRYAVQSTIGWLFTVAGTLLFVVPGVVWLAATQLAGVAVVAEDVGPFRAFGRSAELTRGARWKLLLALGAIEAPIAIVQTLWGDGPNPGLSVLVGSFVRLFTIACYAQLAGQVSEPSTAPTMVGWRHRLLADPALVVAVGWSLVLGGAMAARVGSRLLHPEPSLLLIPPSDGVRARLEAPQSEWCSYSLHARGRECDVARWAMSRARGAGGFTFQGARCVPAGPDVWQAWRARLVAHAADALTSALPTGMVVRSPYRIGSEDVDVAVLADAPADAVVLALDVEDPATETDGDARARRLAAAGVPNYWRVEAHASRDPVAGEDTLRMSSDPDRERGAYVATTVSTRNQDLVLRVKGLPGVRVAIDAILPEHPCTHPKDASAVRRMAARRDEAALPAFVTDGSRPAPSLVFQEFDGGGMAHRLTFSGASRPLASGFDPAASGLAVTIAGPYAGGQVMDVVLPAGERWTRTGGDRRAWAFRDPTGAVGGVTDLVVSEGDDGMLTWELEGAGGSWPASWPVIRDWGRLDVRLGQPGENAVTVSFLTLGWRPHCLTGARGSVVCRTPQPPEPCTASEANSLVRCSAEQLARAEEIFFASRGRYFSGDCADLPLVSIPGEMRCRAVGSGHQFVVWVWHPQMTFARGCQWESGSESPSVRCS